MRLPVTVSNEPPASSMPAPTAGVMPLVGAFALLLFSIRLFAMMVQGWRAASSTCSDPRVAGGAVFSHSFAVARPSQPNYLALFSGSTHGIKDDNCPYNFTKVPNLGAELIGASFSFAGYSESMRSDGYKGCGSYLSLGYIRAHNPWVDFGNVRAASNLAFARFPADFSRLPTVSFVIPNLRHDMHTCSRDTGDTWVQHHLGL